MRGFFIDRGYPLSVIDEGLERAAAVPREVALTNVVRPQAKKIPLVIPYCRQTKKIASIVKKNARILASDNDIGAAFQNNILLSFLTHDLRLVYILYQLEPEFEDGKK